MIHMPPYKPYDPWKGKDSLLWLRAIREGNPKVIQAELLKCKVNRWHFLRAWVRTENVQSKDRSQPMEPFPDDPHLFYCSKIWEHSLRNLWPKSRQMTMTWLISALYLHDALFFPSRMTFFQSKKEEDSDANLERVYVMYQNLPDFFKLWQPAKRVYCHLRFTRNRSHIWAIPQGANHYRQFTASGIFSDEMAFQEECDEVLAAAGPGLGQTGRFDGVSSASPSYFEKLVFDTADYNTAA